MDVNVIPVPEPVVHISGTSDISREYEDFKLGVRIFADVHIVMTTGSPTGNGKSFFWINARFFYWEAKVEIFFKKVVKMLRVISTYSRVHKSPPFGLFMK